MTVQSILGVPGAGKSYEAVQWAKSAIESGRAVVTNLPLKVTHPLWEKAIADGLLHLIPSTKNVVAGDNRHFGHWELWEELSSDDREFHREVGAKGGEGKMLGPMVIVDEAMITFQAMIRNKRKNDHWDKLQVFLVAHRHMLIDIVFLYQNHGQMDPAVKQVCERYHHVVNTSEMSGANTFFVGVANKGFVNGNSYLSKRQGKFHQKNYDLYDSYAEGSGAGMTGKKSEIGVRRSKPVWRRWWAILTIGLVVLVLPIAAFKTVKGIKGAISGDEDIKLKASNPVTDQPVLTPQQQAALLNPQLVKSPQLDPNAQALGWPDPSVPFMGFDNENIYFPKGERLNLYSDIEPSGYQVVEIMLCRVTLLNTTQFPPKLIEYKCAKGF